MFSMHAKAHLHPALRFVKSSTSSGEQVAFTAWGISLAAGLVVGLVASIVTGVLGLIPCLGWIVSIMITLGIGVYLSMIYSHLFGQFGRQAFGQTSLIPSDQTVVS